MTTNEKKRFISMIPKEYIDSACDEMGEQYTALPDGWVLLRALTLYLRELEKRCE